MPGVTDIHAPTIRRPVDQPAPFMWKLHEVCHTKAMAINTVFKCSRFQKLWNTYRKVRNVTTKTGASSMHKYFDDKWNSAKAAGNSKMFWDTTKPFMTDKVSSVNENISLKVGDSISDVMRILPLTMHLMDTGVKLRLLYAMITQLTKKGMHRGHYWFSQWPFTY